MGQMKALADEVTAQLDENRVEFLAALDGIDGAIADLAIYGPLRDTTVEAVDTLLRALAEAGDIHETVAVAIHQLLSHTQTACELMRAALLISKETVDV